MNQLQNASLARHWQRLMCALLFACCLTGCATSGNPRDPLEGYNRIMFGFNDAVDKAALKPAATVYQKITPSFVQTAVGNFFGNLGDVWTAVNNALQGKGKDALSDMMRVAVNSTLGLGGVLDIASEAQLPKHKEDFGQTLGRWGVAPGPYIVLPLLGPSTLRDTLGLPLDIAADPWNYKDPQKVRYAGTVLRVIDQRAGLLEAGNLLEEAALDRYEFVRDGFLQRRESKVNDGESPKAEKTSQADDEPAAPAIPAIPVTPLAAALAPTEALAEQGEASAATADAITPVNPAAAPAAEPAKMAEAAEAGPGRPGMSLLKGVALTLAPAK